MKDYEAEIGELKERIEDLQDSFNKETLNKVALQNEIQTLKEEAAFNKKMHDEVCVCVCVCMCVNVPFR